LALLVAGGWLALENARLRQQTAQPEARRAALGQREQELQKELAGQRAANATTEEELERVRAERERLAQELKEQEQQRTVEQQRAARQQPSSPNEGSIAAFILTPQLRGAGQIPPVSIPAKTAYVMMQLELEPNDYPAYRVALLDRANNQTLWSSSQLRARAKGAGKTLSITLRAGLLKSQAYVLQVSGVAAGGASDIIGDYPFRVVK
jgi:hypothetical protein